MKLTDLAFKNKLMVNFLIFALVLAGIGSFIFLPKLEDPEIKVKTAVIATFFPGANQNKVELEVTDVIEEQVRTIGNIEKMTSRSQAGYSEIKISLKKTVSDSEVEQMWDALRRKVSRAALSLPKGSYPPVVIDDFGDIYGIFYAITANGYSYEELDDFAHKIKRDILTVDGVKRVNINGLQNYAIYINLDYAKMANLGVLPTELLLTLQAQDKVAYAGYMENDDSRMRVEVKGDFSSVDDIKNLIISGHESDRLLLSDIANVEKRLKEPFSSKMYYNNEKAIGLSISMEDGHNIVDLGKRVDKKILQIKKELPIGVEFNKVFDQPKKVDDAINQFMINLIESVLIVIIVLLFTMGLRSGYIIGKSLIITILSSFFVLYLFDGTLQRVSLGSIIVAMGMLVDNAIVVVDGILVDLNNGVERSKAMRRTASKTAMPLLGATLIAIMAFLSIFLSPDTAGTYVKDLFIVLAVTLIFSWIFALTQVPLNCDRMLKVKKQSGKAFDSRIYRIFKRVLNGIFKARAVSISIAVLLLVVSLYSFKYIKRAFFPDFNYNQVYIEYKLPETRKIQRVESDLRDISAYLKSLPGVTDITMNLGGTPTRYNLVRTISENSKSYGELIVDFDDYETMVLLKKKIQLHLLENYPEAKARVRQYNLIVNSDYAVEALFKGNDVKVLRSLANQAKDIMQASPYSMSVTDNWEPQGQVIQFNYNQSKSRRIGIDRAEVSTALLFANDGAPVGYYYDGKNKLPLIVRTTQHGESIKNFKDVPVWNSLPNLRIDQGDMKLMLTGSKDIKDIANDVISSVPLSTVCPDEKVIGIEEVIRRFNSSRAIMAQCDPAPGYKADTIQRDVKDKIEAIVMPDGYSLEWRGEQYDQKSAMHYIILYTPIAAFLIIFILLLLFKNYKKMFMILFTIPFAFIGIVPGMLLANKEFGFVAIVGVIGLSGMLIKNGIVLIDAIDGDIAGGKDPFKAVFDAAISRFRPVMMASLTTILGMFPLVKDPMFGSMAITIMCGLLVGTLIILVLLPLMYTLFFKIKVNKKYLGA